MPRFFREHGGSTATQAARVIRLRFLVVRLPYWSICALTGPDREKAGTQVDLDRVGIRFLLQPLGRILEGVGGADSARAWAMIPVTELRFATLMLTAVLGLLTIAVPRRWALAPILVATVLLPDDQRVIVAGLDWTMFRLLILCSLVRFVIRGEGRGIRAVLLDRLLIALGAVTIVATLFLHGTLSAVVNRIGGSFDILGFYFACRIALRSRNDIRNCVFVALLCMVLLSLAMVQESRTGRNLFSMLGGVPAFTEAREGRLRCQGAFSHPIMTGLFAASWATLFASSWNRRRSLTLIGGVAAVIVVVLTASSTPILALFAGMVALSFWPLRAHMRELRWCVAGTLLVLHFVREQPVWHLLARINIVGGSTGWHRFHLIDEAINHFGEWALFGTKATAHWGLGLNDVTNEFILAGIRGGFLAMALLIAIVSLAFGAAGRAAMSRRLDPDLRWMAWCVGAAIFVHFASFFSVAYFGQMSYVWYMHLAVAATLGSFASTARSTPAHDARRPAAPRLSDSSERRPSNRAGLLEDRH